MNENQEKQVMDAAKEAMESNSKKGLIIAGVITALVVIGTVVGIAVKKSNDKKAQEALNAHNTDYETDDFVEAE